MTGNESKITDMKELGGLQEKVIHYLSETPDSHIQAIQKGIDHPSDQYGSVHNAVKALEEMEYIKSKEGLSQKKVPINFYSLTDLGVFYALVMAPNPNYLKILTAYENQNEAWKGLKLYYLDAGQEMFANVFKGVSEFIPIMRKDGIEAAMIQVLIKAHRRAKNLKIDVRKKDAKVAMKHYPELKAAMKEWRDNIDEIL